MEERINLEEFSQKKDQLEEIAVIDLPFPSLDSAIANFAAVTFIFANI